VLDAYCENRREYIADAHDMGSFASHATCDADALHILPDGLPSEYAGPLMCGGATVWGALSFDNVRPTDRVGIVGIGGLGHLAIQFAAKMGCEVVAFSGTESKREEAMKFGAKEFYATKGLKDLKHVPKINQLLVTTSQEPDFSMYDPYIFLPDSI
jgi:D-arabinose 1-dehydrogenase-like Zn-dependent alcohol dehydrogenase